MIMKKTIKRQIEKKVYGCINIDTSIRKSAKLIRKIFLKYDKYSYSPAIIPLTVPDIKTIERMVYDYWKTPEQERPEMFDGMINQYVESALDEFVSEKIT